MKLHYFSDTDTLAITLSSKPSADTRVLADGVTVDFDEDGNPIALDIDLASKRKVDLSKLDVVDLPVLPKKKLRRPIRERTRALAHA
ncbi:MAG TPA: DUF2283 domain-containing protein [Planctomycetota bacterium]|nr:DUF2283 domain-containing protein [Planctomycetota bacterium]